VSDAIARMIERHGPEAVCRALEPLLTAERIARIDQVLAARLGSVVTVVEDTYDPHNAAATIRTTEAIGLGELHVVEAAERFTVAGGVTIGAHRWIELHRWQSSEAAIAALRGRGFRVFATLPGADSAATLAGWDPEEVKQRSFGEGAIPDLAQLDLPGRRHESLYVEMRA